jgi:hypothetical protein
MRTHPGQIGAALRRSKIKVHAGKLFAEGLLMEPAPDAAQMP